MRPEKNGRDPRVRVAECLARAIDVEEAQRHGGQLVRVAERQRHLLVVTFGDRVDRCRVERLVLIGRQRPKLRPTRRTAHLPLTCIELFDRSQPRRDPTARVTRVRTFAIQRHRRRDQEFPHAQAGAFGGQDFEQRRHAHGIDVGIPADLVHALANADHCRQVEDDVGLAHQRRQRPRVADVAAHQPMLPDRDRRVASSPRRGPGVRGCRTAPPRVQPRRGRRPGVSRRTRRRR